MTDKLYLSVRDDNCDLESFHLQVKIFIILYSKPVPLKACIVLELGICPRPAVVGEVVRCFKEEYQYDTQ